jgi:hypothetical protein
VPTPDAPALSPIFDDTHMEDAGGQFGRYQKPTQRLKLWLMMSYKVINLMVHPHGPMADVPAGRSLLWKQKQLEIIELITSQEDASNQLSAGMSIFVERTSTMKKVYTPCSPRAPWRTLIDNPSWCSKRNYYGTF